MAGDGPEHFDDPRRSALLAELLETLDQPAPAATPDVDLDANDRRPTSTSRLRALTIAAATILVIAGGLVVATRSGESNAPADTASVTTEPLTSLCERVRTAGVDNGLLVRAVPIGQLDRAELEQLARDVDELASRGDPDVREFIDEAATRIDFLIDVLAASRPQSELTAAAEAARERLTAALAASALCGE